ncbi:uncharacterized protein KY384_006818 [Bacidia gigantensis]|uniref:uncharacterized protein n=1 Tax=Bacidia gigantensis TaxID=2732470 RepID=UPI001D03A4D0|nr:uncharacterized protein KY384_006818 [Bacidia gigantensis]KAG8527902.1 hypothetical protein KY384_006818 [Bacidia gigantensis]
MHLTFCSLPLLLQLSIAACIQPPTDETPMAHSQTPFLHTHKPAWHEILPVPGLSPAHYNGDPSNDILLIKHLDLLPSPSDPHRPSTIHLLGTLLAALPTSPRFILTTSLGGAIISTREFDLCDQNPNNPVSLEFIQDGRFVTCPVGEGDVEVVATLPQLAHRLRIGFWTVRVEIFGRLDGERVTDFEATMEVMEEDVRGLEEL